MKTKSARALLSHSALWLPAIHIPYLPLSLVVPAAAKMNRSEADLEKLVNAYSAHFGDDSFAIVNDIVRSAEAAPLSEISDLVAVIFGGDPFIPDVEDELAPVEPELPREPRQRQKPPHKPNPPKQRPNKRPNAPPKPVVAPVPVPHNPPPRVQRQAPVQKSGEMKSIWETVISETRAPSRPDDGGVPEDNDFTLEQHDVSTLEDVDPVALAMAENPEFFAPVPTSAEFERSLGLSEVALNPEVAVPAPAPMVQPQVLEVKPHSPPLEPTDVSRLVTNSFFYISDEETEDDLPMPFILQPVAPEAPETVAKVPSPNPLASLPSFANPPVLRRAPAKADPELAPVNSNLDFFARYMNSSNEEASIDFWLPKPPSSDEEARAIFDRLAQAASDSSEGWRGKQWSASGDFAIAPSPVGILRLSGSSKLANPAAQLESPAENEEDFHIDEEALNFLGELFPDFEPSYLADCLRGANNSVEMVSEFLLPVEMESIDLGEDESFFSAPADADPDQDDHLHIYRPEESSSAPHDEEGDEEYGEDDLPEQDSKFNENYHKLVEIYPWVDRDWIVQALLDTDDLEKAADILMRSVAEDRPVLPEDLDAQIAADLDKKFRQERPQRKRVPGGRRGRAIRPIGAAPHAWDRSFNGMPSQGEAPLNEFPLLSDDHPDYYDGREGPIVIRPEVRAVNPSAPAESRIYKYGTLEGKPPSRYAAAAAAGARAQVQQVRYVPTEIRPHIANSESRAAGHWAELMQQASAMFENSTTNKRAAVAAFSSRRHGVAGIMAQLREQNGSWQKMVQDAGREFYEDGMKVVDLHGLRLKPASLFVGSILQAHWESGQHYRLLDIITGRGAHSVDGVARIKEDVRRQLRNYNTQWLNEGCVRVLLPKPDYRS